MPNWSDRQIETHLEATEWHSLEQEGFPDAVIFANNGCVLEGTYEQVRYVPEQRYKQLAEVAREMFDDLEDLPSGADDYRKRLEDLGVEL